MIRPSFILLLSRSRHETLLKGELIMRYNKSYSRQINAIKKYSGIKFPITTASELTALIDILASNNINIIGRIDRAACLDTLVAALVPINGGYAPVIAGELVRSINHIVHRFNNYNDYLEYTRTTNNSVYQSRYSSIIDYDNNDDDSNAFNDACTCDSAVACDARYLERFDYYKPSLLRAIISKAQSSSYENYPVQYEEDILDSLVDYVLDFCKNSKWAMHTNFDDSHSY